MNAARILLMIATGGALLYLFAPSAMAAMLPGWIPAPEDGDISGGGGLLGDLESALVGAAGTAAALVLGGAVTSEAGRDAIKRREGLVLTSYPDGGFHSIGYGHQIKAGESYTVIDNATAEALFDQDIASSERTVNVLVSVALTQAQFDALVSFVYNVGEPNFRRSTLRALLNAGDLDGARAQFAVWTRSGEQRNFAPLVQRRADEAAQFSGV